MRLAFLSVVFVLSQACGRGRPPDASAARKADAALRLRTTDPEALQAIHDFLAFQRQDHHAGMHHGA